MKWSEEETVKFAELYRESECLWNMASPTYKNKSLRQKAVENLVKDMGKEGFGIQEVKQKIKNLRSTYNQEMLKIKKSAKSGSGLADLYVPSIKWFSILDHIMKSAKGISETTSNLMAENENDDIAEQPVVEVFNSQPVNEEYTQPSPSDYVQQVGPSSTVNLTRNTPTPSSSGTARGTKRRLQDLSHAVKDLRAASENLKQPVDSFDENHVFGIYIAKSLNKLGTVDALLAKEEIQAILTKYRIRALTGRRATNDSFYSTDDSNRSPSTSTATSVDSYFRSQQYTSTNPNTEQCDPHTLPQLEVSETVMFDEATITPEGLLVVVKSVTDSSDID